MPGISLWRGCVRGDPAGEQTNMLSDENKMHARPEEPVTAGGFSVIIPRQDDTVAAVFDWTDSAMRENKKLLKGE